MCNFLFSLEGFTLFLRPEIICLWCQWKKVNKLSKLQQCLKPKLYKSFELLKHSNSEPWKRAQTGHRKCACVCVCVGMCASARTGMCLTITKTHHETQHHHQHTHTHTHTWHESALHTNHQLANSNTLRMSSNP